MRDECVRNISGLHIAADSIHLSRLNIISEMQIYKKIRIHPTPAPYYCSNIAFSEFFHSLHLDVNSNFTNFVCTYSLSQYF